MDPDRLRQCERQTERAEPPTDRTLLDATMRLGVTSVAGHEPEPKEKIDVGSGFSRIDATGAAAEFIEYLDTARRSGPISQAKQWSFEQLRLAAGDAVLDVGCGTGDDVATLARMVGPSGRAVGIDSSGAMVSESIRRHGQVPGVSFQLAKAEKLPLESGSFDACRAERTLQQVGDPERALAEILFCAQLPSSRSKALARGC